MLEKCGLTILRYSGVVSHYSPKEITNTIQTIILGEMNRMNIYDGRKGFSIYTHFTRHNIKLTTFLSVLTVLLPTTLHYIKVDPRNPSSTESFISLLEFL